MTTTQKDGWGIVCIVVFFVFLVFFGVVGGAVAETIVQSLESDYSASVQVVYIV